MCRKRHCLPIGLICLLLLGCMQPKERCVTIQGAISHLGSTHLYITYTDARFQRSFDTIQSNMSGRFVIKLRTCDDISAINLYFAEKKCWTTLFVQPGDLIKIRGNIESVDLLSIQGGKVNNDLNRFKSQIKTLYQERLDILKGIRKLDEASEIRLAEINLQLKRAAKEFIVENPTSIASVVLIQDFFYQDYDPNTIELLSLLKGDASKCRLADKIREGIHERY